MGRGLDEREYKWTHKKVCVEGKNRRKTELAGQGEEDSTTGGVVRGGRRRGENSI